MTQPVLGILTLYLDDKETLEERSIYRHMITAAKKMGLEVFVFTPADVDFETNRIHAQFYNTSSKSWTHKWTSFPHMIYDRCRIQHSHRFEQLRKFRSRYGHLTFLNKPLRNKWTVYKTLSSQSRFQNKQPFTMLYTGHKDLSEMLSRYPLVFLKPINGTGGRGILRIELQKDDTYLIQGRDQTRRIIQPQQVGATALKKKLSSWNLEGGKYIVQQGIMIKLPNGRVHDYRLLVQKNSRGEWEATGCAGRIGAPKSITSNLHGGGKAMGMDELLGSWVGDEARARAVRREAEQFGVEVAAYLEQQYDRLCELALDLAIDRKGGIWLLEVNPKPAREVFRESGDEATYERAIVKPLEYAMYVYSRRKRKKSKSTGGKSQGRKPESSSSGASSLVAGSSEESSSGASSAGSSSKSISSKESSSSGAGSKSTSLKDTSAFAAASTGVGSSVVDTKRESSPRAGSTGPVSRRTSSKEAGSTGESSKRTSSTRAGSKRSASSGAGSIKSGSTRADSKRTGPKKVSSPRASLSEASPTRTGSTGTGSTEAGLTGNSTPDT
ncbi:YheC/YheD family protein [Paenibacillus herberti]|uniref:ATP-binding protein n=1 Tax=Paenibacillus herberti TaxID=1619309 RepID=A0A229NZB7_9BACL|nr:YheC/YheD family protein [Paenibacillus herberti]OXM15262.1 ATP-binding protein [Paenibacillus herberti]